ncbi:MAG: permease-like cell division protein FtsX [Flavobacteriaceae bacterium]
MAKLTSFEQYQKRRLRSSYVSVIFSIALVLFILGLLALLIFHTQTLSKHFKEKYAINVFIKDKAKEKDFKKIRKFLEDKDFTTKVKFVSKKDALKIYVQDVGEDFMEFLGDNPLNNSFDLYLKSEFVDPDKIKDIEKIILKNKFIDEVSYDKSLVSMLSNSVKKISFWLLAFAALLSLITIVLINSYLRLSIYAKRFNIKTMQMVGATKRFIRKPFLYRSVKLGMIGAIVAIIALVLLLLYFNKTYPDIGLVKDKVTLMLLFASVFILGIVITWLSTYFATKRFLNLTAEELHY